MAGLQRSYSSSLRGLVAMAALALLTVVPAIGQIMQGGVAIPLEPTVTSSSSMVLDTARGIVDVRTELRGTTHVIGPIDPLRHLPAVLAGWRINGEIGSLQWPIYLSAAEAVITDRFRLSYRASAAVLPDMSILTLTINDVVIGRSGIASPAAVKPIEFDIPHGLLRQGFNAVRLSVEQRHGVDCSLDATYELWTQVIPQSTGFLLRQDASRPPIDLDALATLRPRLDGALPIEVMIGGRMKPQRVEQILLAAQAIALAGRFQAPIVQFVADGKALAGVRLIVGTAAEIALSVNWPADKVPNAGPAIVVLPARPDEAPTIVVSGRTDDDVTAALAQLAAFPKMELIGTPSGMKLAAQLVGFPIVGGERLRLRDIGSSDIEFSGRFFRHAIDVAMPSDFMSADYGRLTIDLAGGYAAGLSAGAQVRVEVNGQNGASVALPNATGDVFRHNEIFVPLGLFKPGSNRIDILAQLTNRSDDSCEASRPVDQDAKRFLLLADTEIRFPPIARLARAPDLLPLSASGFPYAGEARPRLQVPAPDRETLSAAATLAVRMAVAAGRPIPFAFAVGAPGDGDAPTLIVSPAQTIDPTLMAAIGLDPDLVRRAWESQVASPPPQVLQAVRVVLRDPRSDNPPQAKDAATTSSSRDVVDRWSDTITQQSRWGAVRSAAASIIERGVDAASNLGASLQVQTAFAPPVESDLLKPSASLVVAQGWGPGNGHSIVTVVTAPTPSALAHGVEQLIQPTQWPRLRGRLTVVDAAGDLVTSVDSTQPRYIATRALSLNNARLIAAGWFSLNPLAYVITTLLIAALLALATFSLIRHVGRRNI